MEELRLKADNERREGRGRPHDQKGRVYPRYRLRQRTLEPLALSISAKDWRRLEAHARSNAVIRMAVTDEPEATQERPVR